MTTLTDNQFAFRTLIKGRGYKQYMSTGINEFLGVSKDVDISEHADLVIDWQLRPYIRSYGIECILPEVLRVSGIIEWETEVEYLSETEINILREAGGTEYINGTMGGIITIDSALQHWQIGNELEFEINGGISIDEIEIDFEDKTILVK